MSKIDELSTYEKATAVAWLISHQSYNKVKELFEENFNKPVPYKGSLYYLKDRFLETGSVNEERARPGRPITARGDEAINAVSDSIITQPGTSVRRLSDELNMPKSTVHRILKEDLNAKAWKPTYSQELADGDSDRRLQFCERMKNELDADLSYLRKLTFSDECTFHLSGQVNKHNLFFWGKENPKVNLPIKKAKTSSVTVWALAGYRGLIDFEFIDSHVTAESYCKLLNEKVVPFFSRPLNKDKIYQHDGAPAHYSMDARHILDTQLTGRWIGRRGHIEWPARSPDLTVCDFWLWPYLRDKVYSDHTNFKSIQDLKDRIRYEINAIPSHMFSSSFKNFHHRVEACNAVDGLYFE